MPHFLQSMAFLFPRDRVSFHESTQSKCGHSESACRGSFLKTPPCHNTSQGQRDPSREVVTGRGYMTMGCIFNPQYLRLHGCTGNTLLKKVLREVAASGVTFLSNTLSCPALNSSENNTQENLNWCAVA